VTDLKLIGTFYFPSTQPLVCRKQRFNEYSDIQLFRKLERGSDAKV
jgi:hypothetical protein